MLSQKALTRINLAIVKQNRRGDCCQDYLGRRFILDTNIKTINWENTSVNGITYGTAVYKTKGKYVVGNYEYKFTDEGLQISTKAYVTSNHKLVKKLIDENVSYGERRRILDSHNQQVTWKVFSHHSNLPDWGKALYKLVEAERPNKMPCVTKTEKKTEFLNKCKRV